MASDVLYPAQWLLSGGQFGRFGGFGILQVECVARVHLMSDQMNNYIVEQVSVNASVARYPRHELLQHGFHSSNILLLLVHSCL